MTAPTSDAKADLHRYLQTARDAMLWKLDGLGEYDIRRPLTPTGTNLLGLTKHLAAMEIVYFGGTFGRPYPAEPAWISEDAEVNADMWATPGESRADIVELYRAACAHADATISALGLDSPGQVSWWSPERRDVTLHRILIHMIAESNRHAGHADIVRELIDGAAGMRQDNTNLPPADLAWWADYRDRLEQAAKAAAEAPR